MLDSVGNVVVKYVYDAWGNHKILNADGEEVTEGIGVLNPFRYRGYYYDSENNLYYLQTRYYDPEVGRFISQDGIEYADPEAINGLNLYAYCGNNPVMAADPTGNSWKKFWGWFVTAVIAVAAVVAIAVVACGVVASGGLLAPMLVGAGIGALTAMGGSILAQGGFVNADPWKVASAGTIGAIIGAVSGAFSHGVGVVGSSIGESIGTVLGNATHISSGIKFGHIFGKSTLSAVGKFLGDVLGGIVGGTGANYFANKFFGKDLDYRDMMQQGIEGEIPMWLFRFFKWL